MTDHEPTCPRWLRFLSCVLTWHDNQIIHEYTGETPGTYKVIEYVPCRYCGWISPGVRQ